MNIQDVDLSKRPKYENDQAAALIILNKQRELEESYWKIEKRPSKIIEINSREGQVLIKDFLWRAMEEVGEFYEARELGQSEHADEELADALHFVAGLSIITRSEPEFTHGFCLPIRPSPLDTANIARLVMAAGKVGNCLKMKPWKQTDVMTDVSYFRQCIVEYTYSFVRLCASYGLSQEKLYNLYWAKSEVNLFRIRSKY